MVCLCIDHSLTLQSPVFGEEAGGTPVSTPDKSGPLSAVIEAPMESPLHPISSAYSDTTEDEGKLTSAT